MIESLTGTHADLVLAIARIVLGIIFFAHGAQKMLGWYGGVGLGSSMRMFTEPSASSVGSGISCDRRGIIQWNRTGRRAVQQNCRTSHRAHDGWRHRNCS